MKRMEWYLIHVVEVKTDQKNRSRMEPNPCYGIRTGVTTVTTMITDDYMYMLSLLQILVHKLSQLYIQLVCAL